MRALIPTQWRLVRTSALVFTLAGIVLVPPLTASGWHFTIVSPQASTFVVFLAASLAARLFGSDVLRGETTYLRTLPIARSRWFDIKLVVGLGVLLASFLLQAAFWSSSLDAWLVRWMRTASYRPAAVDLDWAVTLTLALVTFSVTAYFAASFERPVASAQAGLPGYLSALVVHGFVAAPYVVLHPARAWLSVAVVSAGALCLARMLYSRRGLVAHDAEERILGRRPRHLVAAHALGQLSFVAAPLAYVLADNSTTNGFRSSWRTAVATCVLVGLLALPWTLREARAIGLRARRAWLALALRTSFVGASIWKALRDSEGALSCATCGRERPVDVSACRACGATRTRRRKPWRISRWIPTSPWPVALAVLPTWMVVGTLLGQIACSRREVWTIHSDLPGVTVAMTGGPAMDCLRVERTTPLPEAERGHVVSRSGWAPRRVDLPNPVTISELRSALRTETTTSSAIVSEESARLFPYPDDGALTLGDPRRGDRIDGVSIDYAYDSKSLVAETVLHARLASLEAQVDTLLDRSDARAFDASELRCAPELEPALTSLLLRRSRDRAMHASTAHGVGPRWTPWDGAHGAILDALVRRHYGIAERVEDRGVAERALSEVHERRGCLQQPRKTRRDVPMDVEYVYLPLRALALAAPAERLEDAILDRDAYAAYAAGMRAEPALYDACKMLWIVSLSRNGTDRDASDRGRAALAACWAMLRIDRERAANEMLDELLRSDLTENPESWRLLSYSGSRRVVKRLEELLGQSVHDANARFEDVPFEARDVVLGIDAGWELDRYWPDS